MEFDNNLLYEGHSVNNESDHGMGCMSDSIEGIMWSIQSMNLYLSNSTVLDL